jgi:ABC-type transport system substrate-binding protein
MGLVAKVTSLLAGEERRREPVGTVHVVDPSPLNWLSVLYDTAEELVRVSPTGHVVPAAMAGYRRVDDRTLDVDVREGERFPDGEPLTTATVKRSFDEVMRWAAPHPPGTQFNLDPRTR